MSKQIMQRDFRSLVLYYVLGKILWFSKMWVTSFGYLKLNTSNLDKLLQNENLNWSVILTQLNSLNTKKIKLFRQLSFSNSIGESQETVKRIGHKCWEDKPCRMFTFVFLTFGLKLFANLVNRCCGFTCP